MKHTPGPWCIDDTLNSLNENYEGQDIIISTEGVPIATVRGTDDMSCIDEEDIEIIGLEVQANAKLIAAAPDLLAALIKARDYCNIGHQKEIDELIKFVTA